MDLETLTEKWVNGALDLREAEMFIHLLIIENVRLKKLYQNTTDNT